MKEEKTSSPFGDFVYATRMERGLLQREVAKRAGLTQAYLSKVELGKCDPTLTVALRICEVLEVDINEFVKQNT